MSVLQRLERLPMARPQWRLLFQGGLGHTFDGMDAALVAFILPSATVVFSLTSGQIGLRSRRGPQYSGRRTGLWLWTTQDSRNLHLLGGGPAHRQLAG